MSTPNSSFAVQGSIIVKEEVSTKKRDHTDFSGSERRCVSERVAEQKVNRIEKLVIHHRDLLLEAWHEHFGA